MGQGIYKNEKQALKTVKYTGSDTIKQGYALCYDRNTVTAPDGAGVNEPATDYSWGRHGWVEKPATGNLHNFAGIVADAPDKTGPCWVSLIEPDALPRSMNVFTSANCTIDSTLLTVVAGSYELGGVGEGVVVGKALQTVDRSSTSGLAQAMIRGLDPMSKNYGDSLPSSAVNAFSPLIWEKCPWNEINLGLVRGHTYFTDFINVLNLAAAAGATNLGEGVLGLTDGTAGSIITIETDEPTGVLSLESTTDNEDCGISAGGSGNIAGQYLFSTSGHLFMEARIKTLNITDSRYNVFLGLAEEGLLTNGGVITTSDAMADKDYVGFRRIFADGDKYDTIHNTAGGGGETVVQADAVAVVADTYQNLGIHSDGTTVTFYHNGVALTTVLLAATNFPDGEEMAFYYNLMLGHADTGSTEIDWLKMALID